ncbi:MAG: ISNCY family transposase [Thermomicrobiales bacterium]
MMETLTLTGKEQIRLMVVTQVMTGELAVAEAASMLGLSERQIHRLKAACREQGAAGIIHGNRGRQPVHRLPSTTRERVVALLQTRYAGVNDTHAQELLAEQEGISISRPTLHRIRREAGMATVRPRRSPQHRRRRERKAQSGMLIQIDGSKHRWLGDTAPWLTLIACIDDATGTVVAACFREQEDTAGYFHLLQQLIAQWGRPQALYHDRHSIFVRSAHEPDTLADQLVGHRQPTQFGRALQHLGIASVIARSPQAKGRIERLFGTLQDRLLVEMRLAGVQTLDQANQFLHTFLPRFNARFAVPPLDPTPAWRPLEPNMDLWQVCSFTYLRTVAADDTIRLGSLHLQLAPRPPRLTWARSTVEVREHLDGSLSAWHAGYQIALAPAPPDAGQLRARAGVRAPAHGHQTPTAPDAAVPPESVPRTPVSDDFIPKQRRSSPKPWKPPANHPWRQYARKRE